MRAWLAAFLLLGAPLQAQNVSGDSGTFKIGLNDVESQTRAEVLSAEYAVLRGLDKTAGVSREIVVQVGEPFKYGRLSILLNDCRYPKANPTGDAYASLTVKDLSLEAPVFDAWMVASSPALMAMDHPRYDVWVIRCKFDNQTPSVVAGESSPRPLERPVGLSGN